MPRRHPTPDERDERVILPLDPEEALRGLLAVDLDGVATEDAEVPPADATVANE